MTDGIKPVGRAVLLLWVVWSAACGQSPSYKDTFSDLDWWPAEEPAGDCAVPNAVDGPGIYFVSPDGDDAAAGTLAAPWRTLGHAAETLTAGETVFARAGTYPEVVEPQASGADGAWITYAAYPGEGATVDGSGISLGADSGLLAVVEKEFIRLCGLQVANAGPNDNACGILVDRSSHVVVGGCQTTATASSGIGVWNSDHVIVADNEVVRACDDGEQECITIATTDTFVVRNNHVHHSGPGSIGGEGIDLKDGSSRGLVYGNHVHDVNRLGIYIEAWDKHTHDIFVYGNLVHDTSGDGFTLASEKGGLLQNVRVFNNVAYANACSGVGLTLNASGGGRHPLKNLQIVNNTLVDNGSDACYGARWGGGILVDNPDVHQVVLRNNLVSQNLLFQIALDADFQTGAVQIDHNLIDGGGDFSGATSGEDSVEGDPGFADPAEADFHLTAASPALDMASSDLAPAQDYDGIERPRGAGVDIGAFEF